MTHSSSKHPDDTVNDLLETLPGRARRTPPRRRRVPLWALILLGVVVIVLGGIAAYLLLPIDAPLPDDVATRYAGVERGLTDDGFPRLGSPDAPYLVEDFSSYACPHCRTFHEEEFAALLDEIEAGAVQFVLIPMPFGWGAETATRGALCASAQGRFWEMNDTLFYWQNRFIGSTFHERRITLGAEALGLDMDAFEACMDGGAVRDTIERARTEFDRRGLRGTPSLFLNGEHITSYAELDELGAWTESADAG